MERSPTYNPTTRNKPFTFSCVKPSLGPNISLNSFRTEILFFVFQCQKSQMVVFTMVWLGARFLVNTAHPLSPLQPERDLRPFVDPLVNTNLVAKTSDNE